MKFRSVFEFATGTFISRVVGFIREIVFAYALGSSQYADAIVAAIRIPTMLRGMLAEGISQNAFVPVILRWKDRGLLWALIFIILSATTVVVILGIILSPYILSVMTPGFLNDPSKFRFTNAAMDITFPSMLFISATAIQTGILNSRGKFFISGFSPIFFNIGMISVLVFAGKNPLLGATSFLVGCILQFAFLLPFSFERFEKPNLKHRAIKEFLKNWFSLSLNTGFLQLSTLINTIIASFLPTGSLAYLNYAFRIVQLPQGLIGVSTGVVLSREVSEREDSAMKNLKRSIKFVSVFSILSVLFFAVLGLWVIDALFVRGKFTHYDALQTYKAVLGYSLAVPSFVFSSVLLSYLFAMFRRKDANTGLVISTITNLILAPILARYLGFVGIAMSVSLSQSTAVLFWIVKVFGLKPTSLIPISVLVFSFTISILTLSMLQP